VKIFLNKITVLVCIITFESYGSESDDDSDSNRSLKSSFYPGV